jgi:uncharacterized membrane protein YhaH (DUF805 family)
MHARGGAALAPTGEATMGFGQAVSSVFANYFNFKSRASRSEYWYYALFLLIAGLATLLIDFAILGPVDIGPVNVIFTLATMIPSLAVSVRRLHDIGRSGWFVLLGIIPLIGIILLIYWWCQPSDPQPNKYGAPPA